MFCKKCGTQIPDNTSVCYKCGTLTGVQVARPISYATPAAPGALNVKALALKGVSLLLFILFLVFWGGDTLSAYGSSGPMSTLLTISEGGFINVIATIVYIVALVFSVISLAIPFVGNAVPAGIANFFGKKVFHLVILTVLGLVAFLFGFLGCVGMSDGMIGLSFLGIFNIILHIANIVVLAILSGENKK